jgi:DNA-binding transcriptional LysR family regulator
MEFIFTNTSIILIWRSAMARSKLDLNLLETFDAVCLAGSLKRAAENLHMTQSAVSMQIKRLEEAVHQQLLERSTRGLSVTPAGERMRQHARELLRLENRAVADLRNSSLSGELRIGVPTDYAPTLLSAALPYLEGNFPDVEVTVTCDLSRVLRKKIGRDLLDIAIVTDEPGVESGIALWSESLCWVEPAGKDFAATVAKPVGLLDVDCVLRDLTQHLMEQRLSAARIAFRSSSLASICSALEAGFCAALLPQDAIPEEQARSGGCRIFPLKEALHIRMIRSERLHQHLGPVVHFIETKLLLSARGPH